MDASQGIAERFEGAEDAAVVPGAGGNVGEVGVADIEIEAQAKEPGLVNERAQVSWLAHFAGGVFHADGNARVARVQDQVFEGAKSRVAFFRVGGLAGAAHVHDHALEGQVVGNVDGALEFVHGIDAADAFDFADGKRNAAFAGGAEIAAAGRVNREQLQAIGSESAGHGADFRLRSVVEVSAREEDFKRVEPGSGD